MANQEHLALLLQGTAQWNEWRAQHPQIQPDLRGAHLNGADLNRTDLSYADLSNADLSGAYLRRANLSYGRLHNVNLRNVTLRNANLTAADLSYAHLRNINLRNVTLCDADLNHADLSYANLSNANLRQTNLRGVKTVGTIFAGVDLRETRGLVEIDHQGPSRVELQTIQLPQDGSALHFLRGAGVADEWIEVYRSMRMHPIQYHSCFLSYSSRDELFARRLHADLQDHGVRCWFAPEDLKTGDKIRARIDEAIHVQEKLLLLLSEHALASDWVEVEVEAALEKEQRQSREVLFPVRLDESVMQASVAWAKQLRRGRHIGDFTNWTDPQAYQSAFERLLRDLKKADDEESLS